MTCLTDILAVPYQDLNALIINSLTTYQSIAYNMPYPQKGQEEKMGTTKTATARALLDPKVKTQAEKILKELGLSVSKSFELFYRQVIAQRGLPFELQVPNEKTMKAIENSRQGRGKRFDTPQELFDDLGI